MLTGCGLLPTAPDSAQGPQGDLGQLFIEALPDVANAAANLLSTFVYTAVVVAFVFPAARFAAVGVFVAFYDRITSWIRPSPKPYDPPNRSVQKPDEPAFPGADGDAEGSGD